MDELKGFKKEGYLSIRDIEARARDTNVHNANETESKLGGHLITLSVLFLTVSVVALGNSDISKISIPSRVLIMSTFLLIVMSIMCGVKYFMVCTKYYADNGMIHHENYEYLRNVLLNADPPASERPDFGIINENGKRQVFQADTTYFYIQIALLGLGAISCSALLASLLFVS